VRRQLKRAAGEEITAEDFTADEADQLRLWKESRQRRAQGEAGRHRSTKGGLRRRRRERR
jgi:hypothetical protein